MFISGHFHVLAKRKPHFQCNANPEDATASPRFCNEPHPLHVFLWMLCLEPPSHPGQSTALLWLERLSSKCTKLHTVAPATTKIPRRSHSISACSRHIYMDVVLQAHPVCGEWQIHQNSKW